MINKAPSNHSSMDSGIELSGANKRRSVNFNKMKHLLEKNMGIPVTGEIELDDDEDNEEDTPRPSPPPPVDPVPQSIAPPTVPPTSAKERALSTSNIDDNKSKVGGAPPPIPRRAVSTVLTGKESPLLQKRVMSTSADVTDGSGIN